MLTIQRKRKRFCSDITESLDYLLYMQNGHFNDIFISERIGFNLYVNDSV